MTRRVTKKSERKVVTAKIPGVDLEIFCNSKYMLKFQNESSVCGTCLGLAHPPGTGGGAAHTSAAATRGVRGASGGRRSPAEAFVSAVRTGSGPGRARGAEHLATQTELEAARRGQDARRDSEPGSEAAGAPRRCPSLQPRSSPRG